MYSAIVFDVNETLLDLKAMDSAFETHFGPGSFRKEWFGEVLKLAFVTTITGRYSDFGLIGKSALEILESRHGEPCTERQRADLLALMRQLPPHPDVPGELETLRSEGFRLVALTNSTASTAEAQLTHAGIREFFERVFSADTVRRLKPAREPYDMVASELEASPRSLLLVAAHSWDIAGAIQAGWSGAFITRPGQILDALTPKPQFVAPDLVDLARQIIQHGESGFGKPQASGAK
jgi:2-haloacid dehalogenase